MTIAPGDAIPDIPVKLVTQTGVDEASAAEILGSGTVVMFTVPGAFTPTCHLNHLPGFIDLADRLRAAGADRIVCATANDHHVVKAWAEATEALGKLDFIADGSAKLAEALGIARDLSAGGMGTRFARASLIVRDGAVENVEVETQPGEVSNSGAQATLDWLENNGSGRG